MLSRNREYTRPKPETGTSSTLSFTSQDDEYACTESAVYEKLFDYVRNNVLVTPSLIRLTDLTQTMISYMRNLALRKLKSPPRHIFAGNLKQGLGVYYSFVTDL